MHIIRNLQNYERRVVRHQYPQGIPNWSSIRERVIHIVRHSSDQEDLELPIYVRADIRPHHLRSRTGYTTIERQNIQRQMERMGMLTNQPAVDMRGIDVRRNDEWGHIVAASIGGTNEPINFFPQAFRMNRGDLWNRMEGHIREFLGNNPNGHVNYEVFIIYNPTLENIIDGRQFGYRLIGICVSARFHSSETVYYDIEFCTDNDSVLYQRLDNLCTFDIYEYFSN